MKHLIYCDFSTLKCNRKQFYEVLSSIGYCENIDNFLWTLDFDDVLFDQTITECIHYHLQDFIDEHSKILIVNPKDYLATNHFLSLD